MEVVEKPPSGILRVAQETGSLSRISLILATLKICNGRCFRHCLEGEAVNVKNIIDDYLAWLRENIHAYKIDGASKQQEAIEIETPFLNHLNDAISIYAISQPNGKIRLSDGAVTLEELSLSGIDVHSSPKRRQLIEQTSKGFGIHWDEETGELFVEVKEGDKRLPLLKHSLIQAILATYDLIYLSKPRVAEIFAEDVARFLDKHNVRYTDKVKFTGKTGLDHYFDFVIPRSMHAPERFLQAINHPRRDRVEHVLWMWLDTSEVRKKESKLYVILNDEERELDERITEPLASYDAVAIPWSKRQNFIEELRA